MGITIRKANPADAAQWLQLLKAALGEEYPDKQVYDVKWCEKELSPGSGIETWVADSGGKLEAAISVLPPLPENNNPIANLGRYLARPDAYENGAVQALLQTITEVTSQRNQIAITRVLASDNALQVLLEQTGFLCVGFQPYKHVNRVREGVLFYVRFSNIDSVSRLPISESLPQINELANAVLSKTGMIAPAIARDGAVGYPLQTELAYEDATEEEFQQFVCAARAANPPTEISGVHNLGCGYLRTESEPQNYKAMLARRDGQPVAGVLYQFDPIDRCVRLAQAASSDDLSMGALIHAVMKAAQERFSAVYVEVDVIMTAPRLLKSAEQLGFVPIAYLPAFYRKDQHHADVVKLVKLNMVYSPHNASFTADARHMVEIIDHNFQDQKIGVAIINLLRTLPIFDGLGDGELRKIARLFTQKLYRPGERIFNKGETGNEAYVVMRGQVDILLDEQSKAIASIGNGQIFGELAFLDGAARGALAVAVQPSILLVIQRSAFNNLVQHEPHLGMVVTRNIALELSNRLRKTNAAVTASRR